MLFMKIISKYELIYTNDVLGFELDWSECFAKTLLIFLCPSYVDFIYGI